MINMIIIMIMSMGYKYISELQPSVGLLAQVIYEHGELRWKDVNRGNLLVRPPEFSDNPTSRVI
jgi:hypothetical protein